MKISLVICRNSVYFCEFICGNTYNLVNDERRIGCTNDMMTIGRKYMGRALQSTAESMKITKEDLNYDSTIERSVKT